MANKNDNRNSELFNSFWEASKYSPYNIKEFAKTQESYSAKDKPESILEYPYLPKKLILPKNSVNRLAGKRKSERTFSTKPLSKRELGTLLSSFYAYNDLEHRSYPSAGASYAVEIFCVANNVTDFSGKILYYNPDIHAISIIGEAPSWDVIANNINVPTTGIPQCIIIFVLFSDRLTTKYLERGGRFGIIEVGAAMQQLAIQIAGSKKLKGVAAGGLIDDFWLKILELDEQESKVALGYLCGI